MFVVGVRGRWICARQSPPFHPEVPMKARFDPTRSVSIHWTWECILICTVSYLVTIVVRGSITVHTHRLVWCPRLRTALRAHENMATPRSSSSSKTNRADVFETLNPPIGQLDSQLEELMNNQDDLLKRIDAVVKGKAIIVIACRASARECVVASHSSRSLCASSPLKTTRRYFQISMPWDRGS